MQRRAITVPDWRWREITGRPPSAEYLKARGSGGSPPTATVILRGTNERITLALHHSFSQRPTSRPECANNAHSRDSFPRKGNLNHWPYYYAKLSFLSRNTARRSPRSAYPCARARVRGRKILRHSWRGGEQSNTLVRASLTINPPEIILVEREFVFAFAEFSRSEKRRGLSFPLIPLLAFAKGERNTLACGRISSVGD